MQDQQDIAQSLQELSQAFPCSHSWRLDVDSQLKGLASSCHDGMQGPEVDSVCTSRRHHCDQGRYIGYAPRSCRYDCGQGGDVGLAATSTRHDRGQHQYLWPLKECADNEPVQDATQQFHAEAHSWDADQNNTLVEDRTLRTLLQRLDLRKHKVNTRKQQIESMKQEGEKMIHHQTELFKSVCINNGSMETDVEELNARLPEVVEKVQLLDNIIQKIDANSEPPKFDKGRDNDEKCSDPHMRHVSQQYDMCTGTPGTEEAGAVGCDVKSFQNHRGKLCIDRGMEIDGSIHQHENDRHDLVEFKNQMLNQIHLVEVFNRDLHTYRKIIDKWEHVLGRTKLCFYKQKEVLSRWALSLTHLNDQLEATFWHLKNAISQARKQICDEQTASLVLKLLIKQVDNGLSTRLNTFMNTADIHIKQTQVVLSSCATQLQKMEDFQCTLLRAMQDMDEHGQNLNASLQHAIPYLQQVSLNEQR